MIFRGVDGRVPAAVRRGDPRHEGLDGLAGNRAGVVALDFVQAVGARAHHVHLEALLAHPFAHDFGEDHRLLADQLLRPFMIDEVEDLNHAAKLWRPLHGCLIYLKRISK